jgi:hypothetical protein
MALLFNNNLLNKLFGAEFNSISVIPVDVTTSESHTRNQSITRRAIEGGGTVTDGVMILPDSVNMNCIIKSDLLGDSWQEKLAKIDQIRLAREPFSIVTSLGTYESMFFDGAITIDRDVTTQTILAFTATFSHIDIIETISTLVPKNASGKDAVGQRRNAPAEDAGKKQLEPETAANKKESILASWLL